MTICSIFWLVAHAVRVVQYEGVSLLIDVCWLQDGKLGSCQCRVQRLVSAEVGALPDDLEHALSTTHGVVLGGDVRVVEPGLGEVTPLVIAGEVGQ